MANPSRQWFRIGSMMLCMDFELRCPVAYVQTTTTRENYRHWTPNQDADLFAFIARVGFENKRFQYNPHNSRDANQALLDAVSWCVDKLGPPVHFVSHWAFLLKCLMFWKYEIMWCKGKIVGMKPRNAQWKTDEQQLLDDEWAGIRKQLENE